MATSSDAVTRATTILHGGTASLQGQLDLISELKREKRFGLARRLIGRARQDIHVATNPTLRLHLGQQHALCTYKDLDSSAELRFERAVEILTETDNLRTTTTQETLGIAGAIYKNRWETFARREDLERSLAYYWRGYEEGVTGDDGYTAINAAYVLDLLADHEDTEAREAATTSTSAATRREQARRVREDVIATMVARTDQSPELLQKWWVPVTIGEAYFGLRNCEDASKWLQRASTLSVPEWEYETTARQLASIARLQARALDETQDFTGSASWKALADFLGTKAAALAGIFRGKVGLALSGGGFRASLFHIGVLARLAELDVLRSVEYLSCVSGGSIIGAHYYLEVRKLLQQKSDAEITRDDYIAIVQRIERDFLAGVQRNIRTRMLASPTAALRMLFQSAYSRTNYVGDLFESELFARVDDGEQHAPRFLNRLFVAPKGEVDFRPKDHNWRRCAKVPILVLNATTLNTGHNWQFTASWMGEPPSAIDAEIDANVRMRRLYYDEAPAAHKGGVRLGTAVVASACVPGLFEPIDLSQLYPDYTVRLVDGGVHDNQGVASLLEQGVSVMLVSDASGQSESQRQPSGTALGVPLRSNSILQARVRQAQYDDLDARRRAGLLRGLMFVHLKKDLDVDPVDWIDCADPHDASEEARPAAQRGVLTRYGISKEMQRLLSEIRTDLDSFNDAEAFALMTSGFRMTELELERTITGFTAPASTVDWRFLAMDPLLRDHTADNPVGRLLAIAKDRGFKVWKLSPWLNRVRQCAIGAGIFFTIALVLGAIAGLIQSDDPLQHYASWWATFGTRVGGALGVIIPALLTVAVVAKLRGVPFERTAIALTMGSFGWLFSAAHLWLFDPLFLRIGRVTPIAPQRGESAGAAEDKAAPPQRAA